MTSCLLRQVRACIDSRPLTCGSCPSRVAAHVPAGAVPQAGELAGPQRQLPVLLGPADHFARRGAPRVLQGVLRRRTAACCCWSRTYVMTSVTACQSVRFSCRSFAGTHTARARKSAGGCHIIYFAPSRLDDGNALRGDMQVPDVVAAWVEDICTSFDFKRIIPAHLAAPIKATPQDLRCTDATQQPRQNF